MKINKKKIFQDAKIVFDNFVSMNSPENANFSSIISRNSKGDSIMNMTIDLAYEMSKMVIYFTFAVPKEKNDKNYERVIINSNVNVCKMVSGVVGDFLTKMIMDDLKNLTDFELKCPLKPV